MLKLLVLLKLCAAFLISSSLEAQVWPRGKQVLIWPKQDSLIIGDTLILNGYARTSAGVPVSMPLLRWTVIIDSAPTLLFSGNSIGLVGRTTSRNATVFIRWQTMSGLFVDTLQIRFIDRPVPLPWRPGQQALLVVSDTVVYAGDTLRFQAYARTSAGVPVANPNFIYSFTDYGMNAGGQMNGNSGYLVFRDTIRNHINWIGIAWTTRSGIFRDSVAIRTVGESAPAFLPPFNNFPLDTTHIFEYRNQPFDGLLSVDSVGSPFQVLVKRMDSSRINDMYHMWVYKQWASETYDFLGAVAFAPMHCPLKTPNDAPMWNLRWTGVPDTLGTINSIAPYKITLAAMAQLPIDSLKSLSRVSMERYLRRDSTWIVGNAVYEECFGPIPT